MEHLICIVPVMPLRAEPSDRSEMVSQLLFGEVAVVLEKAKEGWVYIRNQFDQYEGWASLNQTAFIDKDLYEEPTINYTSEFITKALVNNHPMYLPMGSFLKGIKNGKGQWGNSSISFKGKFINPDFNKAPEDKIKDLTLAYLNTPYLWGGRSNYGIDCSGFVQSVFLLLGKSLPRDASQQANFGNPLQQDTPLECGDLAFFHNDKNNITHVGIMLNHSEIIHASGKVRIDKLDKIGILNIETNKHTHHLAMVRKIF